MKLSALIPLPLSQPCVQQLKNSFFNFGGRIGLGKILPQLLSGKHDVVADGLFLLHHNVQHCILVQFSALAEFSHTLGLG